MKTTQITTQLANRLNEVLLNGKWVTGTNFKEQIFDLNWEQATANKYSLNSIADLIFHIHYYIAGVLNVFEGGELDIKDKYSFDSPAITSEKEWRKLVDKFCFDSEKFVKIIENMSQKELDETFAEEKYGNYHRNIDVMIEHSYYHLGQVMIIKKLLDDL